MKNIETHLRKPVVQWLLALLPVLLIIWFAANIHIQTRSIKTTTNEVDIFQHLFTAEDYYVYLSAITQGQSGNLLFKNPYVANPRPYLPHYMTYVISGFIVSFLDIWQPYIYHSIRITAQILFVVSTYYLAYLIIKKPFYAWLTVVIMIFASAMPSFLYNQDIAASFPQWWNGYFNIIGRFDQRPHYTLAYAWINITIIFLLQYSKTRKKRYVLGSSFFLFSSVINIPFTIFISPLFTLSDSLSLLIKSTQNKEYSALFRHVLLYVLHLLPSAILIFIFLSVNTLDPVWSQFTRWETEYWRQESSFIRHTYLLFLPGIPFLFIAAYHLFRRKSVNLLFLFLWLLLPILLLTINDPLGIAKARLLHLAIQVPGAILIAYGMSCIKRSFFRYLMWTYFVFISIYSSFSLLQLIKLDQDRIMRETSSALYYIPKYYWNALEQIKQTIPANSVMLSSLTLASISSAFHPIVAYPGKQTVGLNWSIEKNEVFNFYTQVLSTEQAQQFIKQHSIEYILDGPDAPGWTQPRPSPYPFLEKIWEVDTFVLYKVIL